MKKIVIAAATAALVAGSVAAFSASAQERRGGERPRASAEDLSALSDSRIAALKAGLRLTPEQEKLWPSVEATLKEVSQARIARMTAAREARAQERAEARGEARGQARAPAPAAPAAAPAPQATTPPAAAPQAPAAQTPAPQAQRPAADTLDRMRLAADRLSARADRLDADAADLRKIATAAEPLYKTLDDAQKRRLDLMIREDLRGRMKARGHGAPRHGMNHDGATRDGMRHGALPHRGPEADHARLDDRGALRTAAYERN